MDHLYGIICYWQWADPEHRDKRHWQFVESFAIDSDGHCLTTPSTGGGDRQEWHKWTNRKVYFVKDEGEGHWIEDAEEEPEEYEYDDWMPVKGRAVTLWTLQSGTSLLAINPPNEFPKWLSTSFCEELCKLKEWASLLEHGYDLYFGATNEAERYIVGFKEKDGEVQERKNKKKG